MSIHRFPVSVPRAGRGADASPRSRSPRTRRCSTTRRRAGASRRPTRGSIAVQRELEDAARRARAAAQEPGARRSVQRDVEQIKADIAQAARPDRSADLRARAGAEAPARPVRRSRHAHAQDRDDGRGRRAAGRSRTPAAGAAADRAPRRGRAAVSPSGVPPPSLPAGPVTASLPPRTVDAVAEQRAYDAALDQFKRGDYAGAITASSVREDVSAQPARVVGAVLGRATRNTREGLRGAIATQRTLLQTYPTAPRCPTRCSTSPRRNRARRQRRRAPHARRADRASIRSPRPRPRRANGWQRVASSRKRGPSVVGVAGFPRRDDRLRGAPRRVAARARPPRPALAEHARPLSHLAVGDHAAADAGRDGRCRTTCASLDAFPTSARSPRADRRVLEQWSGLGYYRRAHHLHAGRAARSSSMHGGAFPPMRRRSRRCPASDARPPPRSPRSRSASAARFSTATSSACSRAMRASKAFPASRASRPCCGAKRRRVLPERDIEALHAGHDGSRRDGVPAHASALRRVPRRRGLRRAHHPSHRATAGAAAAKDAAAARGTRARCSSAAARCCSRSARAIGIWGGLWSLPEVALDDDVPASVRARFGARRARDATRCRSLARLHALRADAASAARRASAQRRARRAAGLRVAHA